MRTLRRGQRGPDVRRWQLFLTAQGHVPGRSDGVFDEQTAQATRAFQSDQALNADAVVGSRTLSVAGRLGLQLLRRVQNGELSSALIQEARRILSNHHSDPFGTEVPFELNGIRYVGRIEEHFHPPGGPRKPWGHHVGVSLFIDSIPDKTVSAPDDVTEPAGAGFVESEVGATIATQGVIVIDPGHGGHTEIGSSSPNNARSPSGVLEKELTLSLSHLVVQAIAERAPRVRVELTRTSDVNLSLMDRARTARNVKADLFLSIHFNGFNGVARGVETLIRPKASGNLNHAEDRIFAERVLRAVHAALLEVDPQTPNRGVKEQELGVLRDEFLGNSVANHACRACLLEVEFLDNPRVDDLFNTEPQAAMTRARVAAAIGDALLSELGKQVG